MGRISNRDGFVMIAVIFALTIMSVLAVAAMWVANDDHRAARAMRESGAALFAAEAGVNYVFGHWTDTYGALVAGLQSGDSLVVGKTTLSNKASYAGVIYRVHPTGGQPQYALTVEGRGVGSSGGRRSIRVVIGNAAAAGPFVRGAFGANSLVMGGSGGGSDSYDSDVAAYNAATARSHGDLASNGDITLNNGSTIVKGDVSTHTVATGTAGVSGTVTQGAPVIPPYDILACPAGGYTPASALGPLPSHVTYDQVQGKLVVGSGGNLILTGTTYYFASVTLSGGGLLTLNNGGQHADIWVSTDFGAGGGGVVNTSQKAGNLAIWACGSPTKPSKWDLSGGSNGYMTLYAPNHDVVVGGGGDFYGAIIGATFSATGGSRFHYDEALGRAAGNLQTWRLLPGSWTQLSL